MAETTLSKLQKEVIKLDKVNQRLRESNDKLTKENYYLKKTIKKTAKRKTLWKFRGPSIESDIILEEMKS